MAISNKILSIRKDNEWSQQELVKHLEPLIRRVIRDELTKLAKARPDIFLLIL